jgi:HJR/Mrr/RecB family endonuclease
MGLFDGRRRRAEQLDAQRILFGLRHKRRFVRSSDWYTWESAQRSLRDFCTQDKALTDSFICSQRIEYLGVPEPEPQPEFFAPEEVPPSYECPAKLAEVVSRYQRAVQGYANREAARLDELEKLKALYPEVQAAELERRREWQKSCWPKHVVLERAIYELPDVDSQVKAQNLLIEFRVEALNDLLTVGLQEIPRDFKSFLGLSVEVTESYRIGDPGGIASFIESVLTGMPLPDFIQPKAKVAYMPDSRQLVVEYELPSVKIVPTAKLYRFVKSRESVTETARPLSQVKALYASAIAQLTLLSLAAIFDADIEHYIDVVVFNGVVDTVDPRTGKPTRPCLITVRTTRDTFTEIELAQVDPAACLKHLNAGVSKSPVELSPVRPVLDFSMVDPRFIAETDTLGGLDDRPNLMELTPQQFESLIQNLFEKIGLDTRQTRPSRDGGVDCVAYNTDPILGGKVVIQAKRYKHTVGVSAVRDLYGTLQNEGASKGILVTTSGYGTASFAFAEGKPIELFDGANLLYLLETHAGIKARIEPPDDWQDPVPDSGELPN